MPPKGGKPKAPDSESKESGKPKETNNTFAALGNTESEEEEEVEKDGEKTGKGEDSPGKKKITVAGEESQPPYK